MSAAYRSGWHLLQELQKAGFHIPDNCTGATLVMDVDSVVAIRYSVIVTNEELGKIGQILQQRAEESK